MDSADVLVIGAGQAGAAMCHVLASAGIRVIALEQGGWVSPADLPHAEDEWELEKLRRWSADPNVRQLPEDYPVTGATGALMFNGVGGSTLRYLGGWPRYRPVDFRKGTEHGLESTIDWPLTYEELEPFYEFGDRLVGVSGFAGDPANPPRGPRTGPAIDPGRVGLKAAAAFQRLGWHWWPCDNAILTTPRKGRSACNACGSCAGCPRGALGSADYTLWPGAIANGVDLRTNVRVTGLTLDSSGRASGATYVDRMTGKEGEIRADVVALCANGVGSPRLLLLSAQTGHPDGLANGNGHVGRHLVHHVYGLADVYFDDAVEGYKGAFGATVASQEFYETDVRRGFVNGFQMLAARSSGPATAAMGHTRGRPLPWGSEHHAAFERSFGHHLTISIQGEDLSREDNRVTLDPSARDSSGLPAAHVDYMLGDNDVRLIEFGLDRAAEFADAMGAREFRRGGVSYPPPAWHLLGTCRMGNSPDDSVTNKFHQTWEIPNLFVVDGSSLTTGAAVNPTSTITALALRCADYIRRQHTEILGQRRTPSNNEARV